MISRCHLQLLKFAASQTTADPLQATLCDLDCQFNPHKRFLAYHFHGYHRRETYMINMNNKELSQADYVIQKGHLCAICE
jgi:hypothetical protein